MTQFGSNPSFNSYHFSGANLLNQEGTNAGFSITAPGRVTDLNVFWDGDGAVANAQNGMWKSSDKSLELSSSAYDSNVGSESIGGQTLHTSNHNYFFTTTHTVDIGFCRGKISSSVVSVATGGTDGQTLTVNAITSFSGSSSFNSQYGSSGAGSMRAYGNYTPSAVFVRRSGVFVRIPVNLRRTGSNVAIKVAVRRGSTWSPLNLISSDEWGDETEKQCIVYYENGTWEYGIIRDEGKVRFGTEIDPLHNWEDPRIEELVAV